MTVSLKGIVEDNIVEMATHLNYNVCWLYNFKWVNSLDKFLGALFQKHKKVIIILPADRDDREELVQKIKNIGDKYRIPVMILISERISSNNFLLCTRDLR